MCCDGPDNTYPPGFLGASPHATQRGRERHTGPPGWSHECPGPTPEQTINATFAAARRSAATVFLSMIAAFAVLLPAQATVGLTRTATAVDTAVEADARAVDVELSLAVASRLAHREPAGTPMMAGGNDRPGTTTTAPSTRNVSGKAATVVNYALAQVGKRYRFGTAGPSTFDCSGLVKAAYARVGISLYHQSNAMARRGHSVSRANLRPGDLVFPYANAGHVAIYVGGGKIVHASNPRSGVKISTIYSFSFARRIL